MSRCPPADPEPSRPARTVRSTWVRRMAWSTGHMPRTPSSRSSAQTSAPPSGTPSRCPPTGRPSCSPAPVPATSVTCGRARRQRRLELVHGLAAQGRSRAVPGRGNQPGRADRRHRRRQRHRPLPRHQVRQPRSDPHGHLGFGDRPAVHRRGAGGRRRGTRSSNASIRAPAASSRPGCWTSPIAGLPTEYGWGWPGDRQALALALHGLPVHITASGRTRATSGLPSCLSGTAQEPVPNGDVGRLLELRPDRQDRAH